MVSLGEPTRASRSSEYASTAARLAAGTETARAAGKDAKKAEEHERNVEVVLDLEQSSQHEIEGKPLPKDSPLGRAGTRPGRNAGTTKRPPNQRDGRGAGGAEDVRTGW